MEAYVGAVFAFGFNFAPSGWLLCNGQLLPISEYEVLYALLGTTYGGNGTSTFGVPDLRGRVPIHLGQGPGLPNYVLGEQAGSENVTLTASNMAAHSHGVTGIAIPVNTASTLPTPGDDCFGASPAMYAATADGSHTMAPMVTATGPAGNGPLPIPVLERFNTVNYCICYAGVYPQHP